jgi:predicted ArsR family transcriptional regulator
VIKDDMAIHAGVPEKAVKAALKQFDLEEDMSGVTWDMARNRPGRPTKVYFEAATTTEIQEAKKRLERLLNDSGFDLYP